MTVNYSAYFPKLVTFYACQGASSKLLRSFEMKVSSKKGVIPDGDLFFCDKSGVTDLFVCCYAFFLKFGFFLSGYL